MRRTLVALFFSVLIWPCVAVAGSDVAERVRGRIVLEVEQNGEGWYVSPADGLRYELGRPEQAWQVMRAFALGISNQNLSLIPTAEEPAFYPHNALQERLAGRILLQVESHGEAWYVHPVDLRRYYLGRPADALQVMRTLGLGISSNDLASIVQGHIVLSALPDMPFIAQAPRGNWSDLRQQEGCEEASALMVAAWLNGWDLTLAQAEEKIIALSEFQRERFGYFIDTSARDTDSRLLRGYFSVTGTTVREQIGAADVQKVLAEGQIAIVSVNGRALQNPYFRQGGPLRHMIVVLGYDHVSGEFITHEPGTLSGAQYRYSYRTLQSALNDYDSGEYAPLPQPPRTAMIVVQKP